MRVRSSNFLALAVIALASFPSILAAPARHDSSRPGPEGKSSSDFTKIV